MKSDMTIAVSDNNVIVAVAPYDMQAYDKTLKAFLQRAAYTRDRLHETVRLFLGAPYCLEPLGEGPAGRYSQEPLYRTDRFDCVTYVDTVLALYHAQDLPTFQQNMLRVRFLNGHPTYLEQTQWFTDLEWLPTVRRLGWIEDVTLSVRDGTGQPIATLAETIIDKLNWLRVRPLKMLHRLAPVPEGEAAQQLLQALHAESARFVAAPSTLTYLPLDRLFDGERRPVTALFDQIPSGSVIAIVRPDWPIRDQFPGFPQGYGTNLNVSHLGIAVRTSGGLMFYNATSLGGKVMVEPLTQYLQRGLESPTIKGIHVERIV